LICTEGFNTPPSGAVEKVLNPKCNTTISPSVYNEVIDDKITHDLVMFNRTVRNPKNLNKHYQDKPDTTSRVT
jgi:hypothetical protein